MVGLLESLITAKIVDDFTETQSDKTFKWDSLRTLLTHPKSSSLVMLTTVVVVVATHDLAKGVLAGVLLSAVFFTRKVAKLVDAESVLNEAETERRYTVSGQIFFASAETFANASDLFEPLERVVIDVSRAHFWDITAVAALDKIVLRFRRKGVAVEIVGLNDASATIVTRLGRHDKPGAMEAAPGH